MRYIYWFCFSFCLLMAGCAALGMDVPVVTAADFADTSAAASSIWLTLAGEGTWGAILFAIVGVLWKFTKPYLDEWAERRRMEKLLLAVETGVGGCKAVFTDGMKAANQDGKLTKDEVLYVRKQCRDYIVTFMASQGVDALKVYGPAVIDMLCEWMLAKIKNETVSKVAKAVMPPLPDLAT